jgi:hypothetical protein
VPVPDAARGYLGSVFSGYPVKYFGIALPSWGWKDDAIKNAMSVAHFTVSWVLVVAVALHVPARSSTGCGSRRARRAHGNRTCARSPRRGYFGCNRATSR